MKTSVKWSALAGGLAIVLFFGCQKNDNLSDEKIPEGQAKMSIYLMDDPVMFTKVLIDIRQVAVKIDTAQHHDDQDDDDQWEDDFCGHHRDKRNSSVIWDTLTIRPGVYDLLELRNGVDTLLASGLIPEGKILKVRITLGSDNEIFTDSATSYPLVIFGPHPYFDIDVRKIDVAAITANQFSLWLDFSLQRSIFFRSGRYYLKPFVKPFNDRIKPKLHGTVLPKGASPLVKAYNSTDTLYALPGRDGNYMIRGVNAGTYSIEFTGHHGYQDTTITGVIVSGKGASKAPTVTLHK